jgi:hypothetical protein
MKILGPVLALFIVVGSGCASSQVDQTPPVADLTGFWTGNWTMGPMGGVGNLRLQQTGSRVVGEANLPGSSDLSGPIQGSVVGDHFSYRLLSGRSGVELTIINPDEMSGYGATYAARWVFHRQK